MERLNQVEELKNIIETKALPARSEGMRLFYRGFINESDPEKAKKYYSQAIKRIPFNTHEILHIVNYYKTTLNDKNTAYDILVNSARIYPHSIEINKSYTLLCLELYYTQFAESSLKSLEYMMDKEDYNAFVIVYNNKEKEEAAKLDDW